jgi:metal-responsive CopG/Arc/MetJ family transcriptional regulator
MQSQETFRTVNIRLPSLLNEKLMKHLEKIRKKEPMVSLSEAVRRLLEEGLS